MIAIKSLYAPVVGRLPFAGEKASGDPALFVAVIRHAFTAFAVSRAGIGAGAGACVVAVWHPLLLARGSAFFDYAAFCRRCQRPPFSTRRGCTLFSYPAASPCKHDGGSAVIFLVFALESSRLCQTGIIRTSLGAILFGAFAQPNLANMYTIACVPPVQHHPKISCSEVRAVPRQPIFG